VRFQIPQRGKQYLQTARRLLRAARTMTDGLVVSQLKALTDDFESANRGKVSVIDAAKALARLPADAAASD